MVMDLTGIYAQLLDRFGQQRWWPMTNGFSPPEWEVCIGAVLTQNTNWNNVEKAMVNLKAEKILSPVDMIGTERPDLERLIRPSGFYRQKAARLRVLADFVLGFGGFRRFSRKATRQQLLGVHGLGPETADSILLYALGRPVFVIDAYTKRVFARLGFKDRKDYDGWKRLFESGFPKDVGMYKEFHALIVELAKNYCRPRPLCGHCALNSRCIKNKKR
jgi:endonuclease-3 related protein